MKSRSKGDWTRLFEKLGVSDAEQWASAEERENLGNLPKVAFLQQAWKEIPSANEGQWVESWVEMARRQPAEANIVATYEHFSSLGVTNNELATLFRSVLSQFLLQVAYLLDDPSLDDEELREIISWGLYEDSENDQPIRRLGCIHELVFDVSPEQ